MGEIFVILLGLFLFGCRLVELCRRPTFGGSTPLDNTIGNVVERGNAAYIYDDNGRQICVLPTGSGACDGVVGYTSTIVNIRRGMIISSYDGKGRFLRQTSAR